MTRTSTGAEQANGGPMAHVPAGPSTAELSEWLRRAGTLVSADQLSRFQPDLDALTLALDRPGVRLAVVGLANSGKSTLINRLVGRKVVPVSAMLSRSQPKIVRVDDRSVPGMTASGWTLPPGLEVVDTPGADSDEDAATAVRVILTSSDAVLLTVRAVAPLGAHERRLLEAASTRDFLTPVAVVVTMLDLVPEGERESVLAFVRSRAAGIAAMIPVLVGPVSEQDTTETRTLRHVVENFTAYSADQRYRTLRLAGRLINLIDEIEATASAKVAAAETITAHDVDRPGPAEKANRAEDLVWESLEAELDGRRIRLGHVLRQRIDDDRDWIIPDILVALDRTQDPAQWWQAEFPAILRRCLVVLAQRCEGNLLDNIRADIEWLDDELATRLGLPRTSRLPPPMPGGLRPHTQSPPTPFSGPAEIPALSVAAVAMRAAQLFATGPTALFVRLADLLIGVRAWQESQRHDARVRVAARSDLTALLHDSVAVLSDQINAELLRCYTGIAKRARYRLLMRRAAQAQLNTLPAAAGINGTALWCQLADHAHMLAGAIRTELTHKHVNAENSSDPDQNEEK